MKKHKQAMLALLVLPVVFICGMAVAASYTSGYFKATEYHEVLANPSGPGLLSQAGVYFSDLNNTFRTFGGNDSFNMGEGSDIFHLSGGSDILAMGGAGSGFDGFGDIITFDYRGGLPAYAYGQSAHYLRSNGIGENGVAFPYTAGLELRSHNVWLTSNVLGDVVVVLGQAMPIINP